MKAVKRQISMLLAMALVFSALCFSASAAEYSDSSFLGTSQNITGILLEDDIDALPNAADSNYVTLFSMRAASVSDLLTTYESGKTFTRSSLSGGSLKITGTLSYTGYAPSLTIKVGACTHDIYYDRFDAVTSDYFTNGSYSESRSYAPSTFSSGTTYYGYIKNQTHFTEIYGTLTFYTISPSGQINSAGDYPNE